MKMQELNLFIVDDNSLVLTNLRNYLNIRFGNDLKISTFHTGANALKEVNKDTDIVILDYDLGAENGNDVLKSIKKINSNTEVIMFTSNDEIGVAIESFRNGASDYVIKGDKELKKIASLINKIITYPIRIMVREFGISKYLAIFLLTFVSVGVVVFITMHYMN
ncbi:MAG: response regulator [Bacteroidota bacterium]|nr:response regulator [Bacteroidota bacterium]